MEILELIIFQFADQVPGEFAVPAVLVGVLGLYFFNKIREPIKESTAKQICVVAMAIGVVATLMILLSRMG